MQNNDATEKRIPISKKFNSGIALAPLDWVLREWVLCGGYSDYNHSVVSSRQRCY